MAIWEVRDNEHSVDVEAPNWMMAMGMAMAQLGDDAFDLSCLICDIQPDGVVRVFDPKQDTALLIRRKPDETVMAVDEDGGAETLGQEPLDTLADATDLPEPAAAVAPDSAAALEDETLVDTSLSGDLSAPGVALSPESVVALGPDAEEAEAVEEPDDEDDGDFVVSDGDEDEEEFDADAPAPALTMPNTPSVAFEDIGSLEEPSAGFDAADLAFVSGVREAIPDVGPPEDLAEQLFDGGFDIAGADSVEEAAQASVTLLQQFVPAESGCVLVAGINDTALRFVAATGPSADDVKHITVPFGAGIAGFCHNSGADMIVRDAAHDPRHHGDVDAQSGYRTRSVLAAAVRDADGDIHGCIELLNPPGGFHPWHLDAARSVARTLADYLGPRL